jgi:phosphoglycerate kinase
MMHYLSKTDPFKLRGIVLLRLDFNTEDDWRMRAVLPTIALLLKTSDKIVIASHRGRPAPVAAARLKTGGPGVFDRKFSLRKNAAALGRFLGQKVIFIPNFDFVEIKKKISRAPRGTVFLLENLRFDPGEEKNDPGFAKKLASLADCYVNDAFAVSHRANASVAAITRLLPGYGGLELENEISSLSRVMKHPAQPLVFIVGGAKAADKLEVLRYFRKKTGSFLLGGGPANTILALRGMNVKKSVRDADPSSLRTLAAFAKLKSVVVPFDFRWHGDYIWDLGPKTERAFAAKIAAARTILWSGPLGMIERPAFAQGSIAVAKAIIRNRRAFSLSGGGETVMFLKKYKFDRKFSFISTGGGAMIDFLAGKKLPGIESLKR